MSLGPAGPPFPGLLQDTTRPELELAWPDREGEALTLARSGHLSMAAVLRCYALEIRIKSLICKRLGLEQLPKACKTHDLGELVIFTGLWAELHEAKNQFVLTNWERLVLFSRGALNAARYRPGSILSASEAEALDQALDDPNHGVIAWLSRPR